MKIPLPIEGFEGRSIFLVIRMIGQPKIQVDGEFISKKDKSFTLQDNAGKAVTITLKKHWIDSLPRVEVDNVPFPLRPPLQWYDYLVFGMPLGLGIPAGLFGMSMGGIGALLSFRLFRRQNTDFSRYAWSGGVSILTIGLFLLYWVNTSSTFLMDEALKQEIEEYMVGAEVTWKENNILNAMQLDQQGRRLLSQGKHQEVYDIYRKVLTISYQQGSLQGIMNSLGGLTSVFQIYG